MSLVGFKDETVGGYNEVYTCKEALPLNTLNGSKGLPEVDPIGSDY